MERPRKVMTMTRKNNFFASTGALGAMTAAEQRAGRYLRAPDGHPEVLELTEEVPAAAAPTPSPALSAEEQYAAEYGEIDDGGEQGGAEEVEIPGEKAPSEEPPEKKPNAAEDRIDELTARLRETERLLAEARRAPEKTEEKPEEGKEDDGEDKAPNPEDYEFGEADKAYIADWSRWNARQEINSARAQDAIKEQISALNAGWDEAIKDEKLAELYPDFEEKVTKGADSVDGSRPKWACSPEMALLIKDSKVGPHVAYQLASDPEESFRIARLPTQQQLIEFGRLEGRALAKLEGGAEKAPVRASEAPEPPEKRARGAAGKFSSAQDSVYNRLLDEMK